MTDTTDLRIAALKARLDARRPLAPADLARLDAWFDVELTHTSTALEGNTLTRQETALVLEKGVTVRGKPLKDHLEVVDHRDALTLVRALASRAEAIREIDLRNIHRLVMARSAPGHAGIYANLPRLVAGSRSRFPAAVELPGLMAGFARWLANAPADIDTAFEAHLRLVSIHPFADGNGRTARLLMNLLLARAGYPPVPIRTEHRPDYLDALERAQADGDPSPWHGFARTRLAEALENYLALIEGR